MSGGCSPGWDHDLDGNAVSVQIQVDQAITYVPQTVNSWWELRGVLGAPRGARIELETAGGRWRQLQPSWLEQGRWTFVTGQRYRFRGFTGCELEGPDDEADWWKTGAKPPWEAA